MEIHPENTLVIYTDGSKRPKPNRGGVGMVLVWTNAEGHEESHEHSPPGFFGVTPPQMELQAVIEALRLVDRRSPIVARELYSRIRIYCDASYVVDHHATAKWRWSKSKWRKSGGGLVENADRWKEILRLERKIGLPLEIRKVEGHSTNEFNNRADKLAKLSLAAAARPALTPATVRRKKSPRRPSREGIDLTDGDPVDIHIHLLKFMPVQRLYRYDFSVQSDGRHFEEVSGAYASLDIALEAGHSYRVRFEGSPNNLEIVEVLEELVESDDN
jgi:ribonuclease HI